MPRPLHTQPLIPSHKMSRFDFPRRPLCKIREGMVWTDARKLERQLEEAGNKLLQLPPSVDEILPLLDQVEDYLSRVEQSPSKSMQTALSPSRKALVADDKEMIPSPKPVLNLAKKVEEDAPKTSSKRKRTSANDKVEEDAPMTSSKRKRTPVEEKVEDETPNTSSKKKRTPAKKKASDTEVYGRNLVDSKVKVWWQDDEKFYEGVIVSYDPVKKRHKVSYTDGDKEVLNLRQEKWEFVGDDSMSDAEQAAECRSPDPSHEIGGGASSSKSKGADAKFDRKSRVDAIFSDNKSGDKAEDAGDGKLEDLSKKACPKSNADGSTADGKSKGDGGTPKTGPKPKWGNPEENGRDNRQGDEEEDEKGGEEAGLVEVQEGFGNVNVGPIVESLVLNLASSSLQEETNECDSAPWTYERETVCGPRWWREGDFVVSCVPDGSVIVTLKTKEEIKLSPGALFAEIREEHRPLLSDIFFQWPSTFVRLGDVSAICRKFALDSLVSFVEVLENVSFPKATLEDFEVVYDGLETLVRYRLEVDWLRKRIDQMASLLELPVVRDRLEKVSKELEEIEVVAMRLKDKKKGLEGRLAELKSVSSGRFDMSSHAGQGLRR